MSKYDFAVYGNSIGTLVAALELGKRHTVALINPTPSWGAHFAGLKIEGISYDIGMNLFEFTSFQNKAEDILSYNPALRYDSARFVHMVKDFIEQRVTCIHSPTPQCYFEGIYAGDIIMANELDILRQLPEAIKQSIRTELTNIIAQGRGPLHAANKKKNEALFLSSNYAEVSLANHGHTFHTLFIEPLCQKIFNMSSAVIPALLHRIAWAPLFYPETLLDGLNNVDTVLAPTEFHYPQEGYFAKFAETLYNELSVSGNITVIREKVEKIMGTQENGYAIQFAGDTIHAAQLVWCGDLQNLLTTAGVDHSSYPFTKASITLGFANIDKTLIARDFSTLYICDDAEAIYRITNQDYSALDDSPMARLVFEYNYDRLQQGGLTDDKAVTDNIQSFLLRAGITKESLPDSLFTIKHFKNAVNAPVASNINSFHKLQELAAIHFPDVEMIGAASGFVSTSFNDQIVQGIRLGVKYQ